MGSLIQHKLRRKALRGTAKVVAPLVLLMVACFVQVSSALATIDNTAKATGTYKASTTISNSVTASVPVAGGVPQIGLVKKAGTVADTNGNGVTDVGDKITYTFNVYNLGNVTLNSIGVTDSKVTPISCPSSSLAPGANETCTAPAYTLTQADIDAGSVSNTAVANGTGAVGGGVSDSSDPSTPGPANNAPTVTPLTTVGQMTLAKATTFPGPAVVGAVIHYTFKVTNTGPTTLTNITLADTGAIVPGSPIITSLAPGASDTSTFTADHTLTAADILSGSYTNTATATGHKMPSGTNVTATGSVSTPMNFTASMTLAKSGVLAVPGPPPKAGDVVNYQLVVKNTGNVTLSNVTITDPQLASNENLLLRNVALLDGALKPQGDEFATASFGSDTARSGIVAAAARAAMQASPILPEANAALVATPTLVRMSGATGPLQSGEKIGFLYTLTNTGEVPLTDISIAQPDGIAFGSKLSLLNPNVSDGASIIYTRDLMPDEATAGLVTSRAYVLYHVRGREQLAQLDESLALSSIRTYDSIATASITPNTPVTINAGQSFTFTGTHALTQAEIDAGVVNNTAQVAAQDPLGNNLTPVTASASIPLTRAPKIGVVKTGTLTMANGSTVQPNDVINYQLVVQNLGNVTLTNVNVQDGPIGFNSGNLGNLAPGQQVTVNTSHILTQADIDAASHYDNQAIAVGTPPVGATMTALSDFADPNQHRPTVVPLVNAPSIALLKQVSSVTDTNGNGRNDVGDVIHYVFTVKNTGNLTLNNVRVTDPLMVTAPDLISGGPLNNFAPGTTDSTTFTGKYTIKPADVTRGHVDNTATVTGKPPFGPNVTDQSDPGVFTSDAPTVTPVIDPVISAILQVPTWTDMNSDGIVNAGDIITYVVKVKNTGNQPLSNITFTDPDLSAIAPIAGPLAPFTEYPGTITATHTLSALEVSAGFFDTQLNVSATPPAGADVTDKSDPVDYTKDNLTRFNMGKPAIAVRKTFARFETTAGLPINLPTLPKAGDVVVYTITVDNMSTTPFNDVTVTELAAYQPAAQVVQKVPGPLALGANQSDSVHFQVRQTLSNADLLSGQISNQVTASARYTLGSNTNVLTNPDLSDPTDKNGNAVTIVPLTHVGSFTVAKLAAVTDVNSNGANDTGDIITYTFKIKNTGNVDLYNVTLTDAPLITAGGTFTGGPIAVLPAGATDTTTYQGSYQVTAADLAAGQFTNQAAASAYYDTANPAGSQVTTQSDKTDPPSSTPQPTVVQLSTAKPVLTKTAARSQVKRGEVVPYTITAMNVGAGPFTIADIMPPGFGYVAGSAKANGVAVAPAVVNGQTLTFTPLSPVAGKLTLTLNLLASTTLSGGKFINNARLIDPASGQVIGVAQATVEVIPEAVFDCSDIIGRVFDDLNGDGYMNDGEPGLPGVRLATVNGVLITTDAEGKYHVPCAAIPDAAIGSNFLLKLDPRSLPTGYKVTSENPRDVRVTRGKVTVLNFGAAKVHEVRVDLTGKAFDSGTADLTERWSLGVDKLVKILKKRKSTLLLAYHQGGETGELAQARIDSVATMVKDAWASAGNDYPLSIKTSLEEGK